MNKKYEKYLPLGSVVMLKGAKKKLMITGYVSIDMSDKTKVFDYAGVMYPEGIISTEQNILFNHDDIERIFAIGFSDQEQKEFSHKLLEVMTPENIKEMLEKVQNDSVQ